MVNKLLTEDFVRTFQVTQGNIAISVGASGSDNSTLVVQLIKDGKVLKESTSKGAYLSATISN